jgi:putative peptidoglycan lipid II flippase
MTERLGRSAGIIGLATLGSRVLGLVRDQAQAFFFGTDDKAEAFVVATRIPSLLRELFAEGAMSAAFVPTLSRTLARDGKDAAWRLGSQVINGLLLVTGAVTIAGILFAGGLTSLIASDYATTPGKLELTTELTRINMPFLMLIAVAAACMGMLNALRKFAIPAASPAMFNVVFILSTVILVPVFRSAGVEDITALSVGMLGGGLAQILIQAPSLRREGYRHQWILNVRDPGLREVLLLMGPGTLGAAAAQINLLVNTWLATSIDGAAASLRYAFQLMYLPIGIFGVSIATAAIPELARQAHERALASMSGTVSWGIRLMMVVSIPAIVGLIVLAYPIIELVFERGAFDAESTLMTAGALAFYAPGILGYSIVKIASPGFYSLQEARTPVIISLVTIAANLGLNLWLSAWYQERGLALGTALASLLNAGLLLYFLSRRLGGLEAGRIALTFLKVCLAAAAMGAAAYYVHSALVVYLPDPPDPSSWIRFVRVFSAIAAALAVLAAAAHLLRMEEFREAAQRILGRLRRR